MSSVLGSMALEGTFNVGYRASKAALNKIGQCLADDLRPEGIAVVSMHPGWVRTDMGGTGASIDVSESVTGMRRVIAQANDSHNGKFLNYTGEHLSW